MSDWRKEVKKDSPFLYYFDIEGSSPVGVEIAGYEHIEAFCPGKKKKGMLWSLKFKGAKKMLGVNVTNGNLIEHIMGTADKEKWVGKRIMLRVATCDGEKCIRVHAPGAKLPTQCKRFEYIDADPSNKPAAETAAASVEDKPESSPGEEGGEVEAPPCAASPGPDKGVSNYLHMIVEMEDFTLEKYREVKDIYMDEKLPWQKKWDLKVQNKEYGALIKAMVKALKEACDE